MKRPITSIFVPKAVDENPYQNLLDQQLRKIDVHVSRAGYGVLFLPTILAKWKPDIVHLHWLHPLCLASNPFKSLFKTVTFVVEILILKLLNIKIVWTVHNLKNHENLYLALDRFCSQFVIAMSDAILAHCHAAREEMIDYFQMKHPEKVQVVPLGNYVDSYENTIDRATARHQLGIAESQLVFLFLGSIRPYKGVLELIDAFKQLDNANARLIIAGKVYSDGAESLAAFEQSTAADERIHFIPGYVPDETLQVYMNACDVAVFPYRDILTSGAVLLALSFGCVCVAPRKGCIGEVLQEAGAFLYELDDETGLLTALESASQQQSQLANLRLKNRQLIEHYNWSHIAQMTADVYTAVLSH